MEDLATKVIHVMGGGVRGQGTAPSQDATLGQVAEQVSSSGFRALDRLTEAAVFSGWTPLHFQDACGINGSLETQ